MKKIIESTYDTITRNKKRKQNIDKEYRKLLLSELRIAVMKQDTELARELSKEAAATLNQKKKR